MGFRKHAKGLPGARRSGECSDGNEMHKERGRHKVNERCGGLMSNRCKLRATVHSRSVLQLVLVLA